MGGGPVPRGSPSVPGLGRGEGCGGGSQPEERGRGVDSWPGVLSDRLPRFLAVLRVNPPPHNVCFLYRVPSPRDSLHASSAKVSLGRLRLLRLRRSRESFSESEAAAAGTGSRCGLPPGGCQSPVTRGDAAARKGAPTVRGLELRRLPPGFESVAARSRYGLAGAVSWTAAQAPRVKTRSALPGRWGDSSGTRDPEGAARFR